MSMQDLLLEGIKPAPVEKRVYFDAEFTALHRDGQLISLGMLCDDYNGFYAEFTDYGYPEDQDEWIQEHVIKNLLMKDKYDGYVEKTKDSFNRLTWYVKGDSDLIRVQLLKWLDEQRGTLRRTLQFVTDCYAYDWMLLVDLLCGYNGALGLPHGLDYIPIDISTLLFAANVDPDTNREKFSQIDVDNPDKDLHRSGLSKFGITEVPKHNALWDAYVIDLCFKRLEVMSWGRTAEND